MKVVAPRSEVSISRTPISTGPLKSTSCSTPLPRSSQQRVVLATRVLWLAIVLIHASCTMFYAFVALMYRTLPSTVVSAYLSANQLTISTTDFPVIVGFYAVCAALHAVLLLDLLCMSLRRRAFFFHRFKKAVNAKTTHSRAPVLLRRAIIRTKRAWEQSFGFAGVLGVGSKHFVHVLLVREVLETILQSIQAHQLSMYAPRVELNRFAVMVVALSCWSIPAIQHVVFRYPRLEKILCLLLGLTLDFLSSVGVPLTLAKQYLAVYDSTSTDFGSDRWADKVWVAQMNSEMKLLFVQSWFDFACRALFATALLHSLDDIKLLVVITAPSGIPGVCSSGSVISSITVDSQAFVPVQWNRRSEKLAHGLLVLWGCAILGLHLESACEQEIPECKVRLRPWLSAKPACNYLEIDCALYPGMTGKPGELEAHWQEIDPDALEILIFRNCSDLHIPASIQTLSALSGVYLYSLTLREWSESAALSSKFHPRLRQLSLLQVNMSVFGNGSSLPPGLTSPDFPQTLGTVYISNCGLTELPMSLSRIWPPGINMLFKSNGLRAIPEVLFRMNLLRLSVARNKLRNLPARLFELPTVKWLEVAENPLQELPARVESLGSELVQISFASTNVSKLPAWMLSTTFQRQVAANGGNTPFCAALIASNDQRSVMYCG